MADATGYRIIFGVSGTRGDFQPYLSLGVFLTGRGHTVKYFTSESHCKVAAQFGMDAEPTSGDTEDMLHSEKFLRAMEKGDFLKVVAPADDDPEEQLVNGMTLKELGEKAKESFINFKPHVYVTNMLGHVAELDEVLAAHEVLKVDMALQPQGGPPSNTFKSLAWERELPDPDAPFILTHVMVAQKQGRDIHQALQYAVLSGHADEQTILDAPIGAETVFRGTFEAQKRVSHLILAYSPSVFPVPDDWPDVHSQDSRIHVVGNLKFTRQQQDELSKAGNTFFTSGTGHEDCQAFLRSGPPPVYIGWGSMIVYGSEHMTKLAVEALKLAGQRAIIVAGWARLSFESLQGDEPGLEELRKYAQENVLFMKSAPHEWLFPQCCCCVHHGGIGTLQASLGAGAPTIITPVFADQDSNAAALMKGGWGIGTTKLGRLKSKELGEAIRKVCSDPAYQERTTALRESMEKEDGITRSTEIIENLVKTELLTGVYKQKNEASRAELRQLREKQLKMPFDTVFSRWNVELMKMYPAWKEHTKRNMQFTTQCHTASTEGRLWCVVASTCLVREGHDLKSPEVGRFRKYAFLEQLEKRGSRLRVKKLKGHGPGEGWVSQSVSGKDTVEQISDMTKVATLQAEMYEKLFDDVKVDGL